MWWDSLHDWNNTVTEYRLFGNDTPGWCMKLCLGMGGEPAESLRMWISGKNNTANILMAV